MAIAKRKGRPAKPGKVAPTVNLTMRLRSDLYDAIRSDAELNGRSISAEAERRLSQPEVREIGKIVSLTIGAVENRAGKQWFEDEAVKRQCRSAAAFALDLFMGSEVAKRFVNTAIELEIQSIERAIAGKEQKGILPIPSLEEAEKMLDELKDWRSGASIADQVLGSFRGKQ